MTLTINPDGTALCVYADELTDVMAGMGSAEIRRASHVEPCDGGWSADLTPVGGPVLGPFTLRRNALAAEMKWIEENVLWAEK